MSGGSRQHQKEDLPLRLSGKRSAEGRQGNDKFIRFCPTPWFLFARVHFIPVVLRFYQNVLKYLMTEAKERKQAAFENGWTVSFDEVQQLFSHFCLL